jgi:hypothetical protein
MNYQTGEKLAQDWKTFSEDNHKGTWYLRYAAGALALVVAYFAFEFFTNHDKWITSIFGWFFGGALSLYAACMCRELSLAVLGLGAVYLAYITVADTSPVVLAIIFSAAWIVWAIKSKR